MSSSQRLDHKSHGSWDGMRVDPRKVTIAEDATDHPAFSRHAARRTINRATVADYKRRGVIVPVHLYMDGTASTVAAGRRRIRHACVAANELEADGMIHTPEEWDAMSKAEQKASKKGPPFLVRAIAVSGSPEDTMIAENHHRRDESPLADAYLLSDKLSAGASMEQAMQQLDIVDKRTADNYLLLVKAHPDVQAAVDSFEITMAVVTSTGILAQSRKDQEETLAYYRETVSQMVAGNGGKAVKGVQAAAVMKASVEGLDVAEIKERVKSTAVHFAPKSSIIALRDRSSTLTADARALLNWITGQAGALDASPKIKALLTEIKAEKPKKTRGPNKAKSVANDAANDTSEDDAEDNEEEEQADAAE